MSASDRKWLSTGDIANLCQCTRRHVLRSRIFDRWLIRVKLGKHHRFKDDQDLRQLCRSIRLGKTEVLPPLKDDDREAMEFRFEYILRHEQLAGLTLAERQQIIADFRRDVAYVESAKTPMEQLKRFGERFTLEPEPGPKVGTKPCYSEDTRPVAYYTPDIASDVDGSIRKTLSELVYDVYEREKSGWIKKRRN